MTYCNRCDVGMSSGFRYNLCPPCLRIVAKEQDEHKCCYRTELDELKTEMERLLEGYRNDYKK